MKGLIFDIKQFFRFTSDDGLSYFERKRMAEEHHKAMREPIPSELLRRWREMKDDESN